MHGNIPWILPVALIVAGCAGDAELRPAPEAQTVPGTETAAVSSVEEVRVAARPDVWPGTAPISEAVTPFRVRIDNNGDSPIRVRYADFVLTATNGKVYRALPPFEIEETVSEPAASPYGPITNPGFESIGFGVTPFYSPFYPGFPVAADPFLYDPLYYDTYYDYWREYSLPTAEMIELALPEGTVRPGGEVTGFLYFEELPEEVPGARFEMELVNAATGRQVGRISIPFVEADV